MKNKFFGFQTCGITHRFLQSNSNKQNSYKKFNFTSLIHELSFSKFVDSNLLQKEFFNKNTKKARSQYFTVNKRLMTEAPSNTKTEKVDLSDSSIIHSSSNYKGSKTVPSEKVEYTMKSTDSTAQRSSKSDKPLKENIPVIKYRKDYRPSEFTINVTNLVIDIFDDKTIVESNLTMDITEHYKGSDLKLDGEELNIEKIKLNEINLVEGKHYSYDGSILTIFSQYVPNGKFILTSKVVIHPETNYSLMGLYKSNDLIVSQCESSGFRKITFYLDRPDVMSKFDVTLSADKTKYPILLSNGDKMNSYDLDNNRHGARYVDPFVKPCYLFAVVAGNLKYIKDTYVTKFSKRKVDLYVFTEEKYIDQLTWALEVLKRAMKFDEDYFSLEYDLSRLNLVAVSDFNVGAMENKGLNIFNADSLLVSKKKSLDSTYERILTVVGHEYFHNYTGNRVTLRDWFQLTLKEGLTTHRENLFSEFSTKTATYRLDNINILRSVQFSEDSSPLSHPIRPDSYISMENFYTSTVYDKGSEVMRMYLTILGEKYYKKAMTIYLTKNDGKTATCEDFNEAMSEGYKLKKGDKNANLDKFLLWYSQSGTPHVTATYSYDAEKKEFYVKLQQYTKPDNNQKEKKPLFIPIRLGFINPQNGNELKEEVILEFTENEHLYVFENIDTKPLPSILRGFSAPVYLNDNLTEEERILLLKYDTDSFVRYNSAVDIYKKQILENYKEMIDAIGKGNSNPSLTPLSKDFINAISYLLDDPKADAGFKSYMITLPLDKYIMNYLTDINTDVLADVKDRILEQLASALSDKYFSIFKSLEKEADDLTHFNNESYVDFDQINLRKLRNTILLLLSKSKYPQISKYILEHSNSPYPSNWITSLRASAYFDNFKEIYDKTYILSYDDELLLQKWVAAVSGSNREDIFNIIRKLEENVLKDSKNPNLIRSVYLPFTNNLRKFHSLTGEGYKLLADVIIKVDSFNPNVASQLCGPFKIWNKLDKPRQDLINKEINRILEVPTVSKNVKEFLMRLTNKL